MLESPLAKALFVGNGVTTEFPFAFKVWEPTQIEVTVQDDKGAYGVVTDWTVELTDTGGTVTYRHQGEPLPDGYKLAITRKMPFVQPVDLITGTRWDPAVIEERLDRDCAERQELLEKVRRAILFSATEDNVPSAESYIEALGEYFEGASAARDKAVESAEKAEQAYQSTLDTLPQIENAKADAQAAIAADRASAEQSIDSHRASAEQSIEIMRQSTLQAVSEEGEHYVQLAKNEADRSAGEADRAEEAAERASALADVGIASADKLGLIRLGRGLEIDPNGIVSVRSSITMLAPIVTAPDNLPLGYPAVFTMSAYPGLGNTSIVKYRCTLEGLGTVEVDAEPETGAGEVSFVVPRPVGAGVSKKFSVIAIDTLGNESLPTELTRTTIGASVNAPVILTPEANTDVYSSAGFDVTAGEFSTTGTDDTHASTDWLIAKDADGSVFVVQELETSDLYSHTFLPETLANRLEDDTTYYLFARYNGVLLGGSALSAPVAVVARGAFVHAPEVTSPAAFSDVYSAAGFSMATTSEFATTGVEDTHASTDWLVATDRNGRNVVASALDSEDLKEHSFSAEDLVNVPTDQTVYLFCRFNGAILGKGVLSAGVPVVAHAAGVNQPEVVAPAPDADVYPTAGITVSGGEFSTIGAADTHASTDWLVARDASRSQIVAQDLGSSDKTTHTFDAAALGSLDENTELYLFVRYNGTTLGSSPWSVPVKVVTKAGIRTRHGRLYYRHPNGFGGVIQYKNHQGATVSLFVADAKFRKKGYKWGTRGIDMPTLDNFNNCNNTSGNQYIDGVSTSRAAQAVLDPLTDDQMLALWPQYATDKTARYNCDQWMTRKGISDNYSSNPTTGVPPVEYAREQLTNIFPEGLDIPTIYQGLVLYEEGDTIDENDPTLASYRDMGLGYNASTSKRCLDNTHFWTSSEYSNLYECYVNYLGVSYYYNKNLSYGVVPVRELS